MKREGSQVQPSDDALLYAPQKRYSLVRLGGQSQGSHAFILPLATGRLSVTDLPLRYDTNCQQGMLLDHHATSLPRLLRQMPRLYIVTLRRSPMSLLRQVAKLTIHLRGKFELSPITFFQMRGFSFRTINTLYVSGLASLPRGLSPPGEIHLHNPFGRMVTFT